MSQKKRKDRIPETKAKEANFIPFSKVQRGYLNEIRNRQIKELNEGIESVYNELGIMEKVLKAPPGKYRLRMQDFSGLDVLPIRLEAKKETESEKKPESKKVPPPPVITKDKSGKDN